MPESTSGVPTLTIKVAGSELSAELAGRVSNVKLEQSLEDHHTFEMEVLANVGAFGDTSSDALDFFHDKIGMDLSVEFLEPRQDKTMIWNGLVTGVQARIDEQAAYIVVVRGNSNTILMDGNPRNAMSQESKLSDVASKLIGDAGLTADVEATKTTYPFLYQDGESDYRFLRRSLATEGKYLFWDGKDKKVLVKAKPSLDNLDLTMLNDLNDFSVEARMMPMKSAVTTWDQKTAQVVLSSVTPEKKGPPLVEKALKASDSNFNSVGDRWPETPGFDLSTLDEDSAGLARTLASRTVTGRGHSVRVDVRAGVVVNVGGVSDKYSGKYLVTEVVHHIDSQGYRNEFRCLPQDIAGPRRYPQPQRTQFRVGRITNIEPGDNMGYMARVVWSYSHGGQDAGTESGWLRVLMPHAGADHGFAWLPELDDEVLVAFEGNDLSKGIILGSLYNGQNMGPAEEIADGLPENNLKVITTRSGHKLTFCDEAGAEYIELVSSNAECSLKFDVAGPAIIIHTEGGLKVTSTEAMSFESQDSITFKAGKDIELEATGDINSTSTGKTVLKGSEVNTDAQMKSSLKAGMQVEVKGGAGTVKASVSGVDVQGPLVKLN